MIKTLLNLFIVAPIKVPVLLITGCICIWIHLAGFEKYSDQIMDAVIEFKL